MDTSLVTFGVVAFAILMFFAGFCWFLYMDTVRMEREERQLWSVGEDHEGVFFKKSA